LNNKPAKTFFLLVIVVITSIALMNLITGANSPFASGSKSISAGELFVELHAGKVESIEWQQTSLRGMFLEGVPFSATFVKPSDPAAVTLTDLVREVNTKGGSTRPVNLTILDPPASATALNVLSIIAFPLMLIALIYFLVLRPAQMRGP
jgi:hypothetical protein